MDPLLPGVMQPMAVTVRQLDSNCRTVTAIRCTVIDQLRGVQQIVGRGAVFAAILAVDPSLTGVRQAGAVTVLQFEMYAEWQRLSCQVGIILIGAPGGWRKG